MVYCLFGPEEPGVAVKAAEKDVYSRCGGTVGHFSHEFPQSLMFLWSTQFNFHTPSKSGLHMWCMIFANDRLAENRATALHFSSNLVRLSPCGPAFPSRTTNQGADLRLLV